MKICSIKVKEIIAPDSAVHWRGTEHQYSLMEAVDGISIEWQRRRELLRIGDIAVGKQFSAVNRGESPAIVRGITFEWEGPPHGSRFDPLFVRRDHRLSLELTTVIASILDATQRPDESMHVPEECLLPLLTALCGFRHPSCTQGRVPQGRIDSRLLIVNRYIREHYMLPITLMNLAELVQCNPVYLSNTYSKVFHISPIKYLQQLKMSKAKEWLIDTHWGISEIANRLGYVSSSQFSDLFKRYFGLTPTQYRQKRIANYT